MTIPMFVDEDAHYEYERERYESEIPDPEDDKSSLFVWECDREDDE